MEDKVIKSSINLLNDDHEVVSWDYLKDSSKWRIKDEPKYIQFFNLRFVNSGISSK